MPESYNIGDPTGADRYRWGDRAMVTIDPTAYPRAQLRQSAVLIDTPEYDTPKIFNVQLRFIGVDMVGGVPASLNESMWSFYPQTTNTLEMTARAGMGHAGMIQTIYPLAVPNVAYGDAIKRGVGAWKSVIVAKKLQVEVRCVAPCTSGIVDCVEAIAAVSDGIDPRIVAGEFEYTATSFHRVATSIAAQTLLHAEPRRRQFFISNRSTANLAVLFGSHATMPVASFSAPLDGFTFVLPPNGTYESPIDGFTGFVSGIWDAADAFGGAHITRGFAAYRA